MKWILGYGTRLVWNSVTSTLSAPSKRREAVRDEITCETRRLRLGSTADIVDGFVIEKHGHIGVFKKGVSRQNTVVRLHHRCGDLWRRVNGETQLRFLSVVNGETLQQKGSEPRSGTSTDGIEDQKSLETSTVISELSDSIQTEINNLFPN
ncbi:hypothetical protein F8388_020209 [Cannabis sativa]|uniref:Uncharacterized protein n=1 Tax=Cannabis sativa TaxID=3483 RepID=A0A7J6FVJ1_CANSA|nr:hypothetical protein F8388_020209 [Cannabis sativa]